MHTFRGDSSFTTWLHRLTINCVLMEIRKQRRRWLETTPQGSSADSSAERGGAAAALDSVPSPSIPIFDRISIRAAFSQLPAGYQRVFALHDIEGYTHEEIATVLGIQVGTSKSQLSKARVRLRRLLRTESGDRENRLA